MKSSLSLKRNQLGDRRLKKGDDAVPSPTSTKKKTPPSVAAKKTAKVHRPRTLTSKAIPRSLLANFPTSSQRSANATNAVAGLQSSKNGSLCDLLDNVIRHTRYDPLPTAGDHVYDPAWNQQEVTFNESSRQNLNVASSFLDSSFPFADEVFSFADFEPLPLKERF